MRTISQSILQTVGGFTNSTTRYTAVFFQINFTINDLRKQAEILKLHKHMVEFQDRTLSISGLFFLWFFIFTLTLDLVFLSSVFLLRFFLTPTDMQFSFHSTHFLEVYLEIPLCFNDILGLSLAAFTSQSRGMRSFFFFCWQEITKWSHKIIFLDNFFLCANLWILISWLQSSSRHRSHFTLDLMHQKKLSLNFRKFQLTGNINEDIQGHCRNPSWSMFARGFF